MYFSLAGKNTLIQPQSLGTVNPVFHKDSQVHSTLHGAIPKAYFLFQDHTKGYIIEIPCCQISMTDKKYGGVSREH